MDPQPRKRDADRSRALILDAAERLFAAEGYDAVTMAEIGAAAGLSRGTPGYFFGHKEQLYRVVLERAAATFRMLGETLRLRDAAGARDRPALVRETIEAFVGLLAARRDVVRLIDRDGGQTVGSPHVAAIDDALASIDAAERGRLALTIAALAWYPVAHPEVARKLGIDVDAPGFVAAWSDHIAAVAGTVRDTPVAVPAVASPAAGIGDEPGSGPPPDASPPATAAPVDADPDARFVNEVVVAGKKKKKKKKKKRDKGS